MPWLCKDLQEGSRIVNKCVVRGKPVCTSLLQCISSVRVPVALSM